MSLIERLKSLDGTFKAALAIIAVLPGLSTLLGLVPLPDQIGALVTFLFGFLGIGFVLLVVTFSEAIRTMTPRAISAVTVLALLIGASSAVSYSVFAPRHIVNIQEGEQATELLIPLSPKGELAKDMKNFNGDYAEALANSSRKKAILKEMRDQSIGTEILMIVLLIVAQLGLVCGVTIVAWRVTEG